LFSPAYVLATYLSKFTSGGGSSSSGSSGGMGNAVYANKYA